MTSILYHLYYRTPELQDYILSILTFSCGLFILAAVTIKWPLLLLPGVLLLFCLVVLTTVLLVVFSLPTPYIPHQTCCYRCNQIYSCVTVSLLDYKVLTDKTNRNIMYILCTATLLGELIALLVMYQEYRMNLLNTEGWEDNEKQRERRSSRSNSLSTSTSTLSSSGSIYTPRVL
ncbi:uncharacterized protein LOC111714649 isoform X2 [Eurytemora carolleeae]|nr:uncharacterized protein LOC111714649 isoform X2 [Eurytemora carolleeae]|eukprot:XP_023345569.1 uncharacterized protein LOC111714649 isoform X2 [Eurytemora affinis]